jgi:NAD+ kinase
MTNPDEAAGRVTRPVHSVAIIGSPDKPGAAETLARAGRWLAGRTAVVFSDITYDSRKAIAARPDLLIVLGGDGTLIAAVHGLRERQVPIVGVNLGKLGYLADFPIDELESEGDFLFCGDLPITRRAMMDVRVVRADVHEPASPAVNDCVVFAGPPFHMIEMVVEVDGDEVAYIRGDGVIVATPSGSTAHNLAAGGPILEQANPGTTVATDGRIVQPLQVGDRILISRYNADFLLVRNPRHSEWHALRRKLRWGEGPNMH